MELFFATLVIFLISSTIVEAKTFEKCELARELYNHGIPKSQLADWICLVQWESSFSTTATNKNKNGSTDFGIFQINNQYWCDSHYGANECDVSCQSLLTDDITIAIKCAMLIYSRQGFDAWYGWRDHCKGKPLPDLSDCLIDDIGEHSGARDSETVFSGCLSSMFK